MVVGAAQTRAGATIQPHSLVALKENVYVHMDGAVFTMDRPDAWVVGVIGTSSAYDRCNLKLAQLFSPTFFPLLVCFRLKYYGQFYPVRADHLNPIRDQADLG